MLLFEDEQKTSNLNSSLSDDLLQLNKEFAIFNHFCAFFCDAFASMVLVDELLDTSTLHGINRCSRWLKHRMEGFKARLEALERKSRTESH